uniref:Uncharacterized protein n=1 Tax=viral metagenome TaxID=1070528 RepID=A0A6M3J1P9_9ZZZZ
MEIPEKIKLGGHEIQIRFETTKTVGGAGEYNHYHQLIRLRKEPDTPEDAEAEAFLHEIFEAIKLFNNIELPHVSLTVLSEALFQVIRDNDLDFRKPV